MFGVTLRIVKELVILCCYEGIGLLNMLVNEAVTFMNKETG